jgi:ATP-binding cassette subfamily B protein
MNTIKLIRPFIKSNISIFAIYLFFALLSYPLESLVIPGIFGSFFSEIKTGGSDYKTFFLKAIFFTLVINLANAAMTYLDSIIIPNFNEYIVNQIYKKLLLSYQSEYQDLELGKIVSRLNTLPGVIRELTTDLFNWLLPRALSIIITNIYFLYVSPQLGLVSIVLFALLIWYNYKYSYTCVKLSESRYKKYEERAEKTQDKLSNLFSIYSSANIQGEIDKYEKTNAGYKRSYSKTILCSSKIKFVNNFIQCLMFIILNVMIIHFYQSGKINFSKMISLNMIVSYYIPCISTLMTSIPDYTNHIGIIKSIDGFLGQVNKEIKDKKPLIITNGLIQIRDLKFSHDKKKIFNKFNLEIIPKTNLGIIGESGNGKSTLVKLIMGYFPVKNKTIYIDNKDINKHSIESIRSQIIYLNQNTKLFNETIYYNIQYGNDITEEQINLLIKKFNLEKIFENLENGFKTVVGVNGDKLSGGQKQIVQLLRCYGSIDRVKIAIFDEPTASVDPNTKQTILNIIKDLTEHCTSIMITHDISNLSICNRVIKISQGKIVEDRKN